MERAAVIWYIISAEKHRLYIYMHERIATCIFNTCTDIFHSERFGIFPILDWLYNVPQYIRRYKPFSFSKCHARLFPLWNIHIWTSVIKPIKQWICWYWLFMDVCYVWRQIPFIFWKNSIISITYGERKLHFANRNFNIYIWSYSSRSKLSQEQRIDLFLLFSLSSLKHKTMNKVNMLTLSIRSINLQNTFLK